MESHPTSRKKWIDKAIDLLSDIMAQEVDPEMVARVTWILGETRQPTAVPPLLKALTHRNGNVRRLAASALGKIGDRRAVGPLCKLLGDSKPQVRQYAIAALQRIGDPSALNRLKKIANNTGEKDYNRRSAAVAIRTLTSKEVTPPPVVDDQLFQKLQRLRAALAKQHDVPTFMIFHNRTLKEIAQHRPKNLKELRQIWGIGARKVADYGTRIIQVLQEHSVEMVSQPAEALRFLTEAGVKPLQGPWHHGFALDFHSRFQDDERQRTELGELTYRYKYGGEKRLVKVLSTRLADFIKENAPFQDADGIAYIPSTWKGRKYDPVPLLARHVAQETGLPFLSDALEKVRYTDPQKELRTLAAKQRNIMSAFMVRGDVKNKRILLLDDLYDSGATLQEATRVLRIAGVKEVLVLVLTKTIHGS